MRQAIFELRLIPNKDKLEELINKVEKIDLSSYTAKSVAVLNTTLLEAKAVMEDQDADQKKVDAVLAKLQKAVDGLKKADAAKPTDKDQGTGNTNKADKNQGTSDTKPAKTGDTALPIGWAALGMTAMLAAVFRFLARRKNTK